MPSIILVGESPEFDNYLKDYLIEHKIQSFEIETFNELLPISTAREIKRTLSFSVSGNKLFLFRSGMTPESQNALLKIIEESGENIHFILCCEKEEAYLPTVTSRSQIRRLNTAPQKNVTVRDVVSGICRMEKPTYSDIDKLSDLVGDDLQQITSSLRDIMLDAKTDDVTRLKCYQYCKRLLPLISLAKVNNISENILLEEAFFPR